MIGRPGITGGAVRGVCFAVALYALVGVIALVTWCVLLASCARPPVDGRRLVEDPVPEREVAPNALVVVTDADGRVLQVAPAVVSDRDDPALADSPRSSSTPEASK